MCQTLHGKSSLKNKLIIKANFVCIILIIKTKSHMLFNKYKDCHLIKSYFILIKNINFYIYLSVNFHYPI